MTSVLFSNITRFWFLLVPVIAMSIVILASNELVKHPINNWLTWGAFSYPLSFLVTDITNRLFNAQAARRVVYVGFSLGVGLSLFIDIRIAVASGSAFLIAQLLDIYVFNKLRNLSWWKAPLASSIVGSALDTALFFTIAFAYSDLPWITWAIGDFSAKLFMAASLLPIFRILVNFYPTSLKPIKT